MKRNLLAGILLSFGIFSYAQTTKDQKIAALLTTMGTTQTMKTSYEYMINYYKNSYPDISPEYWEKAAELVNYEDLVNKLTPVYSKHFTEKEIEDLLSFYHTATGKKMIGEMPSILQESMEIGQIWGRELAEKIGKDLPPTTRIHYAAPPAPIPYK